MSKIVFACFAPHPPIILPSVTEAKPKVEKRFISSTGSEKDRVQVKKTIEALEDLGKSLKKANPDSIIISSPHPNWGFNVPLFFLAKGFEGEIKTYLMGLESPQFYFEKGKNVYQELEKNKKYALIASGDLSHCLKTEGPYDLHPDGPKFDKALIEYLKKKDIENFLKLDEMFPGAGECSLRSFSFLLGILQASDIDWKAEILSYEGPFGVGYLVTNFELK